VPYAMRICDKIKKAREAKGLSQKEVATALKMDQSQYSKIESGKTDPHFSTIEKIAKALGMELYELFRANEVFKDVNSLDKSIIERAMLIDSLDKKEKIAFFTVLDTMVAKKQLTDILNSALSKTG